MYVYMYFVWAVKRLSVNLTPKIRGLLTPSLVFGYQKKMTQIQRKLTVNYV